MTPIDNAQIHEIEKILHYEFKDRKQFEDSMNHAWLVGLGNTLIEYCVTRFRSSSLDFKVAKENLTRTAVRCGLHEIIILTHNSPLLEQQMGTFIKQMNECSDGLLDPPKALTDVVASLFSAAYRDDSDDSYNTVFKIFERLINPSLTRDTLGKHPGEKKKKKKRQVVRSTMDDPELFAS